MERPDGAERWVHHTVAGVACAFERHMLGQLVRPDYGGPFDPSSLTEDYEAGLQIAHRGGRGVFVRMRDRTGTLVATCEYFPNRIDAAVKQKARWMVGISLAGWDRMGWHGGPAEWWMRIRDRRATLAARWFYSPPTCLLPHIPDRPHQQLHWHLCACCPFRRSSPL